MARRIASSPANNRVDAGRDRGDSSRGNLGRVPEHFTDVREMLEKSKPDVVSVGVWDKGHAPMTIAAAAAGPKAVLREKPKADSVGATADMLMACQRNGVKLAIGRQRRFLPTYTLAKQMIADGEIGDVRLIASVARDGFPNYSSHQTDMYRYLLSDVECTRVVTCRCPTRENTPFAPARCAARTSPPTPRTCG